MPLQQQPVIVSAALGGGGMGSIAEELSKLKVNG
jgi:hypothetical protein